MRLHYDVLQIFTVVLKCASLWLKRDKIYTENSKCGLLRAHRRFIKTQRMWQEVEKSVSFFMSFLSTTDLDANVLVMLKRYLRNEGTIIYISSPLRLWWFYYTVKKSKSNLHDTGGITPKRVVSGRALLRGLAPGQHSSEETSQRWRGVGGAMSDLTGSENEPLTSRTDSDNET